MPDSYSTSWKELYVQTLKESNPQKLTELIHAAEYAIVLRLQELENSIDHYEERSQIAVAKAALLAVKTYKPGWPELRIQSEQMTETRDPA